MVPARENRDILVRIREFFGQEIEDFLNPSLVNAAVEMDMALGQTENDA